MDPRIRPSRAEDAAALLDLVDALADYEQLPRPDAAARDRLVADGFGDRPRFTLLMADADGGPVGYALFFETYSSFLARPTLYLEDLFVLPAYRGRGLGLALFRAVAAEALRRGAGRLEWAVLTWNEPAIDFYRALGGASLDDWRTFRITADALPRVVEGA